MQPCNRCGKPIDFRQSAKGTWYPINANGKPHFLTCGKEPSLEDEIKSQARQSAKRASIDLKRGYERNVYGV